MFVFKAAVVGAGTMGGQIAQTIAAAGIPVVLKDIDDALVQAGLDEARNVTSGQVGKLVEKGKLTAEQGAGADRGDPRAHPRHDLLRGLRRRRLRDRGGAGEDGDQAGRVRRARRRHARPRDPRVEHLVAVDHRDRRSDAAPGEGRRLSLLLPGLDHALIEIVEGEETSAETVGAAVTFAQAIRKQPITCAEVPGFVVNRILNAGISEVWREQEEKKLSIKQIDEGVGAAGVVPIGPYFLVNLLGLDTVLHVAEHLAESYGDERFYVPKGMQRWSPRASSARRPAATASMTPTASPTSRATASPTWPSWSSCSR